MAWQRFALTFFGILVGAGAAWLVAARCESGAKATFLAASAGGALLGYIGYRLATEPDNSFLRKLAMLALSPLVFPAVLSLVVLLVSLVVIVLAIVTPIGFVQRQTHEAKLRKRMKSKNRYISLRNARRFLEAGRGTLIAEIFLPGGCNRVWFTENDLSQKGMTALTNDDLIALLAGEERPFNSLLKDEYLNEETGKALLTRIPPHWVNSGRLKRMFPHAAIAEAVCLASVVQSQADSQDLGTSLITASRGNQ